VSGVSVPYDTQHEISEMNLSNKSIALLLTKWHGIAWYLRAFTDIKLYYR